MAEIRLLDSNTIDKIAAGAGGGRPSRVGEGVGGEAMGGGADGGGGGRRGADTTKGGGGKIEGPLAASPMRATKKRRLFQNPTKTAATAK